MATTPMGVYYDSSKAVKHYAHRNGDVYLTRNSDFYAVTVIKQTTSYSEEYRTRGRMDLLCAGEFFDIAVRYLRGEIEWTEPVRKFSCKFNSCKSQGCTDKNCPRALGGADYRNIFGVSCPFRKLPHTR